MAEKKKKQQTADEMEAEIATLREHLPQLRAENDAFREKIYDLEEQRSILAKEAMEDDEQRERVADILDRLRMPDPIDHLRLLAAIADLRGSVVDVPAFLKEVDAGLHPGSAEQKYDVILQMVGERKINVIKEIRELTGLGLKDSKDLTDCAPSTVMMGVSKEEADRAVRLLAEAGATASIR
ncbi:MAG: ribosomal protein L7/L12 [bacterium]